MVCVVLYAEVRIREHAIRHINFSQQLGTLIPPLCRRHTSRASKIYVVLQVLNKRPAAYSLHSA
jgi:hypothetical protein